MTFVKAWLDQQHLDRSNSCADKKFVKTLKDDLRENSFNTWVVAPGIFEDSKHIRPILLPPLLRTIFSDIKFGDIIYFSKNYVFNEVGHFAGFRSDDLGLTVDPAIRKELSLNSGLKYNVEIDVPNMRITFLER